MLIGIGKPLHELQSRERKDLPMVEVTPMSLAFPDRRQSGGFPVTDATGAVVAHISPRWTGTAFAAEDANGSALCEATTGWWGLSGTWHATGPDGRAMLSVTTRFMRTSADVHLERGGDFVIRGSAWKRDFLVADVSGVPIVTAVPRTSAVSFRQHDYAVVQPRPVLQLPELVALVQIWRMVRKSDAAAAAGGVAAAGAAGAAS
jgi:hypothetical protein